jgi:hypothetical protein
MAWQHITHMLKETVPFPNGSKWGSKELDRIVFGVQSRQRPRQEFLWNDFFQKPQVDHVEKISLDISLYLDQKLDSDQLLALRKRERSRVHLSN